MDSGEGDTPASPSSPTRPRRLRSRLETGEDGEEAWEGRRRCAFVDHEEEEQNVLRSADQQKDDSDVLSEIPPDQAASRCCSAVRTTGRTSARYSSSRTTGEAERVSYRRPIGATGTGIQSRDTGSDNQLPNSLTWGKSKQAPICTDNNIVVGVGSLLRCMRDKSDFEVLSELSAETISPMIRPPRQVSNSYPDQSQSASSSSGFWQQGNISTAQCASSAAATISASRSQAENTSFAKRMAGISNRSVLAMQSAAAQGTAFSSHFTHDSRTSTLHSFESNQSVTSDFAPFEFDAVMDDASVDSIPDSLLGHANSQPGSRNHSMESWPDCAEVCSRTNSIEGWPDVRNVLTEQEPFIIDTHGDAASSGSATASNMSPHESSLTAFGLSNSVPTAPAANASFTSAAFTSDSSQSALAPSITSSRSTAPGSDVNEPLDETPGEVAHTLHRPLGPKTGRPRGRDASKFAPALPPMLSPPLSPEPRDS